MNIRILPAALIAAVALSAGAQSVNPNVEPGSPAANPAPGRAYVDEVLDFVDPAFPSDTLRQTIQETADRFRDALRASAVPGDTPLTLLPIVGDRTGYVGSLMKTAVTEAGRKYVVAGDDPGWAAIAAQVEWNERKGDILDKDTIIKFGGTLQSARILLLSEIRVAQISDRGVLVEIDAHAVDARTAEHLWGGVFSRRRYVGAEPPMPDDIPREARRLIRESLKAKTVESLKGCAALAGTQRIAVLPLSGDIGGYATAIIKEAVGEAGFTVVNLDASTASEARALLRDKPANEADAFLSGIARRLPETTVETNAAGIVTSWTVDWSASIERASDRAQPWTATVEVTEPVLEKFGWWDRVCHHLPFLRGRGWTLVCVIAVLAVIAILVKANTRVR